MHVFVYFHSVLQVCFDQVCIPTKTQNTRQARIKSEYLSILERVYTVPKIMSVHVYF